MSKLMRALEEGLVKTMDGGWFHCTANMETQRVEFCSYAASGEEDFEGFDLHAKTAAALGVALIACAGLLNEE